MKALFFAGKSFLKYKQKKQHNANGRVYEHRPVFINSGAVCINTGGLKIVVLRFRGGLLQGGSSSAAFDGSVCREPTSVTPHDIH